MRKDIDTLLQSVLNDVLAEIHRILKSETGINTKAGINTLAGSALEKNISGKVTDNGLDLEFPHYIVFIEWNRPEKYKNPPPYSVIIEWLKSKNIRPTAKNIKTVEQLAWVFRYVIWRDGFTARIIAGLNRDFHGESPLDEYVDTIWDKELADSLFDALMKDLEKYFNDF